jgi:hypothetical protein
MGCKGSSRRWRDRSDLLEAGFIREKLDYLHNNPLIAGIVEKPEDYLYSSARFYAGLECVLPVVDIGLPWRTI